MSCRVSLATSSKYNHKCMSKEKSNPLKIGKKLAQQRKFNFGWSIFPNLTSH